MKIVRSFKFAFDGIKHGLNELNMKVHLLITCIVVGMGVVYSVTRLEWAILILCIGLVLCVELINTSVERLCDAITSSHPEVYPKMGLPKDVMAGAVLVAAVASSVVGLIIFIPRILPTLPVVLKY